MNHLTDRQLASFSAGIMSPGDLLAADDHLAGCEACRDRLAAGLPEPPWIERAPSPSEVEDLARFRALVDSTPQRRRVWIRPLAMAAGVAAIAIGVGLWQRNDIPPQYRPLVNSARQTRSIAEPPILAQLRGSPPSQLRGSAEPAAVRLLSPVGVVTASDRPTFRWEGALGAAGYVVSVFDARYQEVARSPALATTEWQPPISLQRGESYSWQIEAGVPMPPNREARFAVLAQDAADRIEAVRRESGSHLLIGLLYAREGVLDLAIAELRQAQSANPRDDSVRSLLQSAENLSAAKQ